MKRALYRLSVAWMLAVMLSMPHLSYAEDRPSDTAPSQCINHMKTMPIRGDLAPTKISMDGACTVPHPSHAEDMPLDTAPSLCLDGMETAPIQDDLVPTEISVDGGCMVPQTPVSI